MLRHDDDWSGDVAEDANRDWLGLILTITAAFLVAFIFLCVGFVAFFTAGGL